MLKQIFFVNLLFAIEFLSLFFSDGMNDSSIWFEIMLSLVSLLLNGIFRECSDEKSKGSKETGEIGSSTISKFGYEMM